MTYAPEGTPGINLTLTPRRHGGSEVYIHAFLTVALT
jgi:hypothetical protein